MLPKPKLNVQNFPRPPLIEQINRHLLVKYRGQVIAETRAAYWILETHHSPTYYLPPSSLRFPLSPTKKSTFCEWKGWATYHSIAIPPSNESGSEGTEQETIKDRIWSFESPNEKYRDLKGYLAFYVGPWECFVDGEEVKPQPGDFYGGWTTSDLEGIVKGEGSTRYW